MKSPFLMITSIVCGIATAVVATEHSRPIDTIDRHDISGETPLTKASSHSRQTIPDLPPIQLAQAEPGQRKGRTSIEQMMKDALKRGVPEQAILLAEKTLPRGSSEALLRQAKVTGKYSAVRLRLKSGRVYVETIELAYDDGRAQTLQIGALLKTDAPLEWQPIRQGSLRLLKTSLTYRADDSDKNTPRIMLEGRLQPPTVAYQPQNVPVPGPIMRMAGPDCVANNTCTPVEIFFGTNRKAEPNNRDLAAGFGSERGKQLSLGAAVVTVPKSHNTVGKIERPSYWNWRDWFRFFKEDPTRHFVIPDEGVRLFQNPEQFFAAVRAAAPELPAFKDHAFVYVHGFNVTFDQALHRIAQLTYDLGEDSQENRIPFGIPFLFSWPAKGKGDLFGIKDYPTDEDSAELSERYLRTFLNMVVERSGARNVHLIAHSMGNQPLLNVLADIAKAAKPDIRFNQVILAAPDVDRDQFLDLAKRIKPVVKNVTLYASSNDAALMLSRTIHSGIPRAGDVPDGIPIVTKEIFTIDATAVSLGAFLSLDAIKHNVYAQSREIMHDISEIFRETKHPPHKRNNLLRRKRVGKLEYWIVPPQKQ